MLDLDEFKHFNDSYGHLAGDDALRHIARSIAKSLRHVDFMGRYGGEEFIFLLAGTDGEQAWRAAERIRRLVADHPVELPERSVPISCSIGLCMVLPGWPGARNSACLHAAIRAADQALYQAKEQGRNQVVLAPAMPELCANDPAG